MAEEKKAVMDGIRSTIDDSYWINGVQYNGYRGTGTDEEKTGAPMTGIVPTVPPVNIPGFPTVTTAKDREKYERWNREKQTWEYTEMFFREMEYWRELAATAIKKMYPNGMP